MAKIPLKARKNIKASFDAISTTLSSASSVFGKELTFIDNTSELFEKLQASGRSEDWLFEIGKHVSKYAEQLLKTLTEFCKNEDNKEQLQAELTSGKVGVRIVPSTKNDAYWAIEDGTLWMETKEAWFGNYMESYNSECLTQKLGKNDSLPLNTRKSLKAAQKEIDEAMIVASTAFGKELIWIDNFQELYDKLKSRSEDWLWRLGEPLKLYAKEAAKTLTEFCKDLDNKEQLEAEISSGKIGVRVVPNSKNDEYWCIEDGILWMETKEAWFGGYYNSYNSELLATKLGKNDSMPLNTRKSLKAVQPKIDALMNNASTAFGKELQWIDNYQELYDKLKSRSQDWLWRLGEHVLGYPTQLSKTLIQFCKDEDNKEALEEVLTTGKVGVRVVDNSKKDEYWCIEEGILWMETKEGWFANYFNSYNSDALEKKL